MTIGEIQRGIEKLRPKRPDDASEIENWLAGMRQSFAGRILPFDEAAAIAWGRMSPRARGDLADALIAATALVRDLTVATRNRKDFEQRGVRVSNPFEPVP